MYRAKFRPNYQKHTPGTMNKLEEKYAGLLELRKKAGEILEWRYEPIKLRLADKTFYTPDFGVVFPDRIELHECKGFMQEDAAVKIKVAAHQHWYFKFVLVQWKQKQWLFTPYE